MEEIVPIMVVLIDNDDGVGFAIEAIFKTLLSDLDIFLIKYKSMSEARQVLDLRIPPDAIIWDGHITDGITTDKIGDEGSLIEIACEQFPECLMIAFSSDPEIHQKQREYGCTLSFSKPMNFKLVIDTIRSLAQSTVLTEQDIPKAQAVA